MAEGILKHEEILPSDRSEGRVCIFAIGYSPGTNRSVFVHNRAQVDAELRNCASLIVFDEFKDGWVALELDGEHETGFIRRFPRI